MAISNLKGGAPAPVPQPGRDSGTGNTVPSTGRAAPSDTFSIGPFHFHHFQLPSFLGAHYPTTPEQRAQRESELAASVAKLDLGPAQKSVLADLSAQGVSSVDIWQGSHVVLQGDQGALYQKWKALGAEGRTSSHYKGLSTQQYQLMFGSHALLFGTNAHGDTWFQFESHPDIPFKKDPFDYVVHRLNWVEYKVTGENVGPFGFSPHAETHDPLVVPYKA